VAGSFSTDSDINQYMDGTVRYTDCLSTFEKYPNFDKSAPTTTD
jgi:hypothetical protein